MDIFASREHVSDLADQLIEERPYIIVSRADRPIMRIGDLTFELGVSLAKCRSVRRDLDFGNDFDPVRSAKIVQLSQKGNVTLSALADKGILRNARIGTHVGAAIADYKFGRGYIHSKSIFSKVDSINQH
jgi:hypothetical protein